MPEPAQQQSKSVEGTARSFFKGGMGIVLNNFAKGLNLSHRNAERLIRKCEQREGIVEPPKSEDDMRIDSDDIHNHYHQQREGMSSLAKLAALGLMATGVGVPAGIAAWNLPEIVEMLQGEKPKPVVAPVEPKTDSPTVNIGGKDYELSLEPE